MFEVYQDANKQWHWRFVASNGKILAEGSKSYANQDDCVHCRDLVKNEVGKTKTTKS
jgi:uncharacterized protein